MSRLAGIGYPVFYFACVGNTKHKATPLAGRLSDNLPLYVYTLQFSPHVNRLRGLRRWLAGLKIAGILARHRIHNPVLWFYHPALFALGYSHSDAAIIYDVMDHFPSFEESIDDFYFDELALLAEADLVFSGGRSLHRHVEQMYAELLQSTNHKQVKMQCLPSGVDYLHFNPSAEPSPETMTYAAPRFVYTGAIDERIDWEVIRTLAMATKGSIIMAGPIIRQPPPGLPNNIYMVGARDYKELPRIIAACDVCLLPFQRSALVQYVSPTKTPEYLAMGKSVISTPIPDVLSDYGTLVTVAETPEDFAVAAAQAAGNKADSLLKTEQVKSQAKSWEEIAQQMTDALSAHLSKRSTLNA